MSPFLMFAIALGLPVTFCLLSFGPVYGGVCVALYAFYGEKTSAYFYDPGVTIDLYGNVLDYWQANRETLGLMDFLLPVFGPFAVGVLLGAFWCFLFIRYVRNIFHV